MGDSSRIFRQTTIANLLISIFTAVVSIVLSRWLGPAGRGDYVSLFAVYSLVVNFSLWGLPVYLAKISSKEQELASKNSNNISEKGLPIIGLCLIGGLLSGGIFVLLDGIGYQMFADEKYILIGILFVTTNIGTVLFLSIYLGHKKWIEYNLFRVVFFPAYMIGLAWIHFYSGIEVLEAFICMIGVNLSLILFQTLSCIRRKQNYLRLDFGYVAKLYRNSTPYALNSILAVAFIQSDYLVGGYAVSNEELGVWAAGKTLAALVFPITHAINTLTFAHYIRDASSIKHEKFYSSVRLTLLISGFLFVVLWACSEFIIGIFFGPKFFSSLTAVAMILVASFAMITADVVEERLKGEGNLQPTILARLMALLSMIFLSLMMSPHYGFVGFGLAYLFAHLFRCVVLLVTVLKGDGLTVTKIIPSKEDISLVLSLLTKSGRQ
ncbi:lipopolysaccharide biosynthesis protein [Haliea sp. E17]|uniref:lipopolysaccharide biosynthesis protein n=1 Tax=Haliea sp. E17 TaxID=3401576 RepID=UPI003AAC4BE3